MTHWPYHRPIAIWCKERPSWCDLGPERDPLRMLERASAHLYFLLADVDAAKGLLTEKEIIEEQIPVLRSIKDLALAANEVRRENAKARLGSLHSGRP